MADITSMLTSLSQSFESLERFFVGSAYLIGVGLLFSGVYKMKEIGNARANRAWGAGGSLGPSFVFILIGSALIYLPTAMHGLVETVYGNDSLLAYADLKAFLIARYGSIQTIVTQLVRILGIMWVVSGLSMLAKSTKPGKQLGAMGLAYTFGGILAFNITGTMEVLSNTMDVITSSNFNYQGPRAVDTFQ